MTKQDFEIEKKELLNLAYIASEDGQKRMFRYMDKEQAKSDFSEQFEKVYNMSKEAEIYWQFCTFDTWKKDLDNKLNNYLKKYTFSRKEDFYLEYLEEFIRTKNDPDKKNINDLYYEAQVSGGSSEGEFKWNGHINLKNYLDKELYKIIFFEEREKKEFLTSQIEENPDSRTLNFKSKPNDFRISYADEDELNFKERYYILNKIGIIDQLFQSIKMTKGKQRVLHLFFGCADSYAKELLSKKDNHLIESERQKELDRYVKTIKEEYL